MTEQTKEQEIAKAKERQREADKTNLESKIYQEVMGSNLVKSNPFGFGEYGKIGGDTTYDNVIFEEDFIKEQKRLYNLKKEEMQRAGVAGEPVVQNHETSMSMMQIARESMQRTTIDDLKKYATDIGAKLEFKSPEKLKKFSYADIIKKAIEDGAFSQEKGLDVDKLSDIEKDALALHQSYMQAYERACAFKAAEKGHYVDINARGSAIEEKYKPTENKAAA